MSSAKLIVVIGTTGTQGSSVVSTFLREPGWRIRSITRNPNSDVSRKLSAKSVETVAADLNDTQTLIRTFKGANAVFAVTDFFWSVIDPASQAKLKPSQTLNEYSYEYEKVQAMNIMDAVSTVKTLERFVWSLLPATKK
jgi:nucleoside-diphosphate-sugar epimerase